MLGFMVVCGGQLDPPSSWVQPDGPLALKDRRCQGVRKARHRGAPGQHTQGRKHGSNSRGSTATWPLGCSAQTPKCTGRPATHTGSTGSTTVMRTTGSTCSEQRQWRPGCWAKHPDVLHLVVLAGLQHRPEAQAGSKSTTSVRSHGSCPRLATTGPVVRLQVSRYQKAWLLLGEYAYQAPSLAVRPPA